MTRLRIQPAIVVMCFAVVGLGCREDATEPEVLEPPTFVRSTVPADSAENVFGSTDISVTFRRSVFESGVILDLFPAPSSSGPQILSPTGRTLTWLAVELDPDELAYRLLVDGASAPSPEAILFYPATPPASAGRMGGCLSLAVEGPKLDEAVVFAIPPGDANLAVAALPDLFRQQHASSIALVGPGGCDTFYFFTYMKLEPVAVIAVLDTSGDGRYDLDDDWWGYRGSESAADEVTPSASPFDVPMDLDITLRAPAF